MGVVVFSSLNLFYRLFTDEKKKTRCHGRGDITNDRVSNGHARRSCMKTGGVLRTQTLGAAPSVYCQSLIIVF